MELEQSALYTEIERITQEGSKPVSNYWRAEIHVNNVTYEPLKLLNVDIVRNYQVNFTDESTVTLLIPLGLWVKVIYPNRTKLEISLFQVPLLESGGVENREQPIFSQRYSANPVTDNLPVFTGTDIDRLSQATLDLRDILQINFQLFSKTVEKIRLVTVGGIYRNNTTEEVIKGILSIESKKVQIDTGDAIEVIDMVPASNQNKRDHVVIPHGIRLIDIPGYIQDRCGGVYSADINSYIQDKSWYVYPLYDTTRLAKAARSMTIIKVPKTKLRSIERTYREDSGNVVILATSDSTFDDDAGTNFLNYGNGVRFASADTFMDGLTEVKDNKVVSKRAEVNSEFVSANVTNRNNVQMSVKKIHSNPFVEYSKLAKITNGIYQFVWENANSNLLFPGMMVRVLYLNGENIEELNGVLMFTHTSVQLINSAATGKKHSTNCALSIFVNEPPKIT